MRLRRRYQEGGRTANLLAALEKSRVMNQLNSSKEERISQPSSAPASSTATSIRPPMFTSAEDAILAQGRADRVGFAKTFGEPLSQEDAKFLRETQELPSGAIQSSYPLLDFFSPVGDIKDMMGAESGLDFAMAAGLAFVPGNMSMIKEALPQFARVSQINNLEKILDAVDDVGGSAEELISVNAPQVVNMSQRSREELASALEEMSDDLSDFPMFSGEEVGRLQETARFLRSDNIAKEASSAATKSNMPKQAIGDFELDFRTHDGKKGFVYQKEGSPDMVSLVEVTPNNYTLTALLENTTNPRERGLILAETIKQVPKDGKVLFGSVNDLSTDSYVFPLSYIEKGKAKADLSNVEFLKLNQLGESPQAFAKAFDIEPRQVGLIDGTEKASSDVVARVKGKIDAKLQSLGLPESQVSGDQILMPHFDMIKTIGKGEFRYGGNLKIVKQSPRGFRTKR